MSFKDFSVAQSNIFKECIYENIYFDCENRYFNNKSRHFNSENKNFDNTNRYYLKY